MRDPSPSAFEQAPQRLASLDGLRGAAAIIVLLYHSEQFHGVHGTFAFGYLAVDFFFLLSGFVLVGPLEQRSAPLRKSGITIFAARFFRFWPLMALGTLIGAAVQLIRWPAEQVLPLLAFAWLSLPLAWQAGCVFALNGPQWSLFVEFVCNALHLVLLRELKARTLLALSLTCGIVLTLGQGYLNALTASADYDSVVTGLVRAGFAYPLGVVMGRKQHLLRALPPMAGWVAPALLVGTIVLPGMFAFQEAIGETFARGAFVVVLAVGVRSQVSTQAARTMTWLGAISFPLYAVHSPILALADMVGRAASPQLGPLIFLGGTLLPLALAHVLSRSALARGIRLPEMTRKRASRSDPVTQSG